MCSMWKQPEKNKVPSCSWKFLITLLKDFGRCYVALLAGTPSSQIRVARNSIEFNYKIEILKKFGSHHLCKKFINRINMQNINAPYQRLHFKWVEKTSFLQFQYKIFSSSLDLSWLLLYGRWMRQISFIRCE